MAYESDVWDLDTQALETLGALYSVEAMIEELQQHLPAAWSRGMEKIEALAKREKWDQNDSTLARDEVRGRLLHHVPRAASRGAIVILAAIVETQLVATARNIAGRRNLPFDPRAMNRPTDAAKRFFKDPAGIPVASDAAWNTLRDLGDLRNVIAHRWGARGDIQTQQQTVDRLVTKYSGVTLAGNGDSPYADVVVTFDQCLWFKTEAEGVFRRLFTAAGIPTFERTDT